MCCLAGIDSSSDEDEFDLDGIAMTSRRHAPFTLADSDYGNMIDPTSTAE